MNKPRIFEELLDDCIYEYSIADGDYTSPEYLKTRDAVVAKYEEAVEEKDCAKRDLEANAFSGLLQFAVGEELADLQTKYDALRLAAKVCVEATSPRTVAKLRTALEEKE